MTIEELLKTSEAQLNSMSQAELQKELAPLFPAVRLKLEGGSTMTTKQAREQVREKSHQSMQAEFAMMKKKLGL